MTTSRRLYLPPAPLASLVTVTLTLSVIAALMATLVSDTLVTFSPVIDVISPGNSTLTVSVPSEPPWSRSAVAPPAAAVLAIVNVMVLPSLVTVMLPVTAVAPARIASNKVTLPLDGSRPSFTLTTREVPVASLPGVGAAERES